MKLEQLSFADLIALRQELHERILGCYKDSYLVTTGKKKDGPGQEELRQMAIDYGQKFDAVKTEISSRIVLIRV